MQQRKAAHVHAASPALPVRHGAGAHRLGDNRADARRRQEPLREARQAPGPARARVAGNAARRRAWPQHKAMFTHRPGQPARPRAPPPDAGGGQPAAATAPQGHQATRNATAAGTIIRRVATAMAGACIAALPALRAGCRRRARREWTPAAAGGESIRVSRVLAVDPRAHLPFSPPQVLAYPAGRQSPCPPCAADGALGDGQYRGYVACRQHAVRTARSARAGRCAPPAGGHLPPRLLPDGVFAGASPPLDRGGAGRSSCEPARRRVLVSPLVSSAVDTRLRADARASGETRRDDQ